MALKIIALWSALWVAILTVYLVLSGHSLAEHGGVFYLILTFMLGAGGGAVHALIWLAKLKFFADKKDGWWIYALSVNLVVLLPLVFWMSPEGFEQVAFFIIISCFLSASSVAVRRVLES